MNSIWARIGLAAAAALLVSSYQNCGQSPSSQNPSKQTAETEEDQIVRAMNTNRDTNRDTSGTASGDEPRAITSAKVNAGTDCKFENLRCIRNIYSPRLEDRTGVETICLDAGVCLQVQTHSYNTREALSVCETCGQEAAAPGGEYNREETTCYLGEPGQPSTHVFALRSTFEDAVRSTMAACLGEQQ